MEHGKPYPLYKCEACSRTFLIEEVTENVIHNCDKFSTGFSKHVGFSSDSNLIKKYNILNGIKDNYKSEKDISLQELIRILG